MYKRNRYSAEITYAHQNRAALANAAPTEAIEPEITITSIGSIDQGICREPHESRQTQEVA